MLLRALTALSVLLLGAPRAADLPPEPPAGADLATLADWIGRWVPVVAASAYSGLEDTGEFLARASDSVTAARLDGCLLVLNQRSVITYRGATDERRRIIRIPLGQIDTAAIQPKVRRPRMLLGSSESVMLTGQLVVPLRTVARDSVIAVRVDGEPGQDSLVAEHLVPFPFAIVPATRTARALRGAAALCGTPQASNSP